MKEVARWVQLVVIVLLGVAAVPLISNQWADYSARQARRDRAARHAELARAAAEAGDPALAQQAWIAALDGDPVNDAYRAGLIDAQVDRILERPSVIDATNALPLQTELGLALAAAEEPPARLLLAFGKVLEYRGRPEEALERYRKAAAADDRLAVAHLFVGDALLKKDQLGAAIEAFDAALSRDPDLALAQLAKGQARFQQEKYADAAKLLSRAAEKMPRHPRAHIWLGRARLEQGEHAAAVEALSTALRLDPDARGVHRHLATAYLGQKRFEMAVQALKLAWERERDVEAYQRLGRLYQQLDEHGEAAAVFSALSQLMPDDPEPHYRIAVSAAAAGDLALAAQALQNAIALAGRDEEKHGELLKSIRADLAKVQEKLKAQGGDEKRRPKRR